MIEQEELVSVIIPTYKRAEYLKRAIESVLNQTYKNIEILVIDDNDPDSTYRRENEIMLKELVENKKIIYIKHPRNMNGAAARNTGIRKAQGKYITFLDDDDYFMKNRIETIVKQLKTNDEYDGAYTGFECMYNNNVIYQHYGEVSGNLKLEVLKQNSFFGTGSNMFFRSDCINKIGFFDEKFKRHQDMEYMVRFFDNAQILAIRDILVIKYLDSKINVPNFENMLLAKKMFLDKFKKEINSYNVETQNIIYFSNYMELLKCSENKDEYKKALDMIKKYKDVPIRYKFKLLRVKLSKNRLIYKIYKIIKK